MSARIVHTAPTPNDPDLQAEIDVDGQLVLAVYRDSPISPAVVAAALAHYFAALDQEDAK